MTIRGSSSSPADRRTARVEGLERSFQYDDRSREEIVELLQPLYASTVEAMRSGRPAAEIVVQQIEAAARGMLRDYLDSVSPEQRGNHFRKVSSAATRLLQLINERDPGSGSAAYLIYAVGRTDQSQDDYSFVPIFKEALAELASKADQASKAKKPPYPGFAEPFPGKRDVEKTLFAQRVLRIYAIEANRRPGRSSTGPAARLLVAAVDPVIKFARSIGINHASLIGRGENAKTLIEDIQGATPIGENLPEL